jgi:hypothetical protein
MLLLPVLFGLGFYAVVGGALFKCLAATLTGAGLMLGSATILVLPSESDLKPSDHARRAR